MSAELIAPPSVPTLAIGPESPAHHVPALRIPAKIAAHIARLTMPRHGGPLLPESELIALLYGLAERYSTARAHRESFVATIEARGHDGKHREFAWTERRRLTPPVV